MSIPKDLMNQIKPHLSETWTEEDINTIPPSILDGELQEKLLKVNTGDILIVRPDNLLSFQTQLTKNMELYEEWLKHYNNN